MNNLLYSDAINWVLTYKLNVDILYQNVSIFKLLTLFNHDKTYIDDTCHDTLNINIVLSKL